MLFVSSRIFLCLGTEADGRGKTSGNDQAACILDRDEPNMAPTDRWGRALTVDHSCRSAKEGDALSVGPPTTWTMQGRHRQKPACREISESLRHTEPPMIIRVVYCSSQMQVLAESSTPNLSSPSRSQAYACRVASPQSPTSECVKVQCVVMNEVDDKVMRVASAHSANRGGCMRSGKMTERDGWDEKHQCGMG